MLAQRTLFYQPEIFNPVAFFKTLHERIGMELKKDKELENLFPQMDDEQFDAFVKDIELHGQLRPISITKTGVVIDGYQRIRACGKLGITPRVEVVDIDVEKDGINYAVSMNAMRRHLTPAQLFDIAEQMLPKLREEARARHGRNIEEGEEKGSAAEKAAVAVGLKTRNFYKLKAIKEENADLFERMKSKEAGVSVDKAYSIATKKKASKGALYRKYIISPLSVLNTHTKEWQQQKTFWINDLGIKSEMGRGEQKTGMTNLQNLTGTSLPSKSVFDPVLVEILVRWFSNKGERVYDPFCGGSVRGVVSGWLGREYIGTDLSSEQVDENRKQGEEIWGRNPPNDAILPCWEVGDAANPESYPKQPVDLILTCPPYFDLEKYDNGVEDVSGMSWADFKSTMQTIADNCVASLKDNGFIIYVVGDVRDKTGYYRRLPDLISKQFTEGKHKGHVDLYNKAIYLTAIATAAMRVEKTFNTQRKLVLVHQEILIFYKGDPSKISSNYEKFESSDLWKDEFLERN